MSNKKILLLVLSLLVLPVVGACGDGGSSNDGSEDGGASSEVDADGYSSITVTIEGPTNDGWFPKYDCEVRYQLAEGETSSDELVDALRRQVLRAGTVASANLSKETLFANPGEAAALILKQLEQASSNEGRQFKVKCFNVREG